MAGIEVRNGRYNIILRLGGKRIVRSLKTGDEDEALAKKLRVEENVRLIESGRLIVPDSADLMTFLLSDGKLNQKPVLTPSMTIKQLFKAFWEALPTGTLEPLSIATMKIHQRHIERLLGRQRVVQELSQSDIQGYITKRSKEKTCHGNTIDGGTIKKEIVTFGSVWRWGVNENRMYGDFPRKNLRFPKSSEAPVFQTWNEIKRQVEAGDSEKLWDALYLNIDQVSQLLAYVKAKADNDFTYPMFAFAAYTGARRSELLRSRVSDIDLDGGVATIREKKRVKGKRQHAACPHIQTVGSHSSPLVRHASGNTFHILPCETIS
jgi:integrase